MIHPFAVRSVVAAAAAFALFGCSSLSERAWVAQGPGGPTAAASQSQPQPQPARPRTPDASVVARPTEVSSGGYTQATRYGDLLFVSGQIAIDPATNAFNEGASVGDQTRMVMENIQRILEGQRLTMANVVSVTVYLKSLNDFRAMDSVYEPFFKSHLPARSVVEVSKLPRNAAVEISVIAGR